MCKKLLVVVTRLQTVLNVPGPASPSENLNMTTRRGKRSGLDRKGKIVVDTASKMALRASNVIWLWRSSKAFRQIQVVPTPEISSEGSVTVEPLYNQFNPTESGLMSRNLRVEFRVERYCFRFVF